jgi:serine/threonine protein kinase
VGLTSGSRLGAYEIQSPLGAGGMGEVYRATDTKLGRDVALKVLPAEMAHDPDRLARFRREAKALAQLDHPNIVTIYSVEESEGVHFLTMQLVEGQPLDRLIPQAGLPLEQIIEIAGALGDALAAAHEKGIVHRDLKPANVMVSNEGRVKVLDFGLAKDVNAVNQDDATMTSASRTEVGVVMGTPAYMSPEQTSGRPLDHRTDIFSLGVLLHEMATGRRPFEGGKGEWLQSSPADTRNQVLGQGFSFAQCMLSGRRVKLAGLFIRHERAITQGPDSRPIGHAQHFVDLQTPAFLNTGEAIDRRIRRGAGGPNEGFTLDLLTGAELDTVVGKSCHPCVHSNLDSSLGKLLLGVATQLFPQFGQDYITGMHEHNPQHVSTKIVVKVNCLVNEIVDSGDGLDAGKAPPATTNVSKGRRTAAEHSVSASSRCAISRFRNWMASPNDFIVSAFCSSPGRLKKFVIEPSPITR